ncbi:hypothetical protein GOP47_0003967 [Adiantum capillus-veneris]|uniref:Uncharacterized protein n=1 Tax=Adiantum capillus-veneris TaxID=13818 RepID=A0A9D4ZME6_ADICA|nr:hypothetical protein GOP47_0003967 [Adiantum capillus-veneris]
MHGSCMQKLLGISAYGTVKAELGTRHCSWFWPCITSSVQIYFVNLSWLPDLPLQLKHHSNYVILRHWRLFCVGASVVCF